MHSVYIDALVQNLQIDESFEQERKEEDEKVKEFTEENKKKILVTILTNSLRTQNYDVTWEISTLFM